MSTNFNNSFTATLLDEV